MKYQITLKFEMPHENLSTCEKTELRKYITDAIHSWGGQRHPEDWLFYSFENIKVTELKEIK